MKDFENQRHLAKSIPQLHKIGLDIPNRFFLYYIKIKRMNRAIDFRNKVWQSYLKHILITKESIFSTIIW